MISCMRDRDDEVEFHQFLHRVASCFRIKCPGRCRPCVFGYGLSDRPTVCCSRCSLDTTSFSAAVTAYHRHGKPVIVPLLVVHAQWYSWPVIQLHAQRHDTRLIDEPNRFTHVGQSTEEGNIGSPSSLSDIRGVSVFFKIRPDMTLA